MATKNYMINDKWLDLDKQNIVELQSVDGVLDSLKVNGSEIETPSGKITITENGTDIDIAQYALADVNVEGGGGSSDFSTAEVTFSVVNSAANAPIGIVIDTTDALSYTSGDAVYDDDKLVYVLYKGSQTVSASDTAQITVEGNANIVEQIEDDGYWLAMINITGDCTINLTGENDA